MSAHAVAVYGFVQRQTPLVAPSEQDIANLAYTLWQKRGSPDGSADQDWLAAERQLLIMTDESLSLKSA